MVELNVETPRAVPSKRMDPRPERAQTVVGAVTHCRYQQPDSTQTLREGLAEYYATNPDLFSPEELGLLCRLGATGAHVSVRWVSVGVATTTGSPWGSPRSRRPRPRV